MSTRIVKAVRTCYACPSQWDAYTDTGDYLYLRFRHGFGTVEHYPRGCVSRDDDVVQVAAFEALDGADGFIELEDFCHRAGIELALVGES